MTIARLAADRGSLDDDDDDDDEDEDDDDDDDDDDAGGADVVVYMVLELVDNSNNTNYRWGKKTLESNYWHEIEHHLRTGATDW